MKICRIVYENPPPWDGLAPHPYEITNTQAQQGHDITVFCGRWPGQGEIKKIKGVNYITAIREPFPGTVNLTSSVWMFFQYLRWRKNNRPDIVHCHGHYAIWIYFYRLFLSKITPWCEELQIPLVVHFHNTAKGRRTKLEEQKQYITPHSKYLQWPLAEYSDRLACKTASACIFVSKQNMDEALKFYDVDKRRCFLVETGVNPDLFCKIDPIERDKSRKELGFDPMDIVIVYVGKIVERKNVHILVEALKHLPIHFKLALVGTGDPAYQQKVDHSIKSLVLEDRIVKIGYSPYPQIPIAYQISDIFALPSSWEGLPKALMEALSTGLPCLVSGFKVDREISGLFYMDNQDPAKWAEKILEITSTRVEVDYGTVRSLYSWDTRVSQIEKVYEFAKNNLLL